jgi:hypothetical protein
VAGRYTAFAGLIPVTGNVFHHAVEMFLKGALAKTKPLSDLKKLGHNLPNIWKEFKAQANDQALDEFDRLIEKLNKFEDIRYPDKIMQEGMMARIDITRAGMPVGSTPAVPEYNLCVEDIDQLTEKIFEVGSRNPKGLFG